jgi:hypothetical protein
MSGATWATLITEHDSSVYVLELRLNNQYDALCWGESLKTRYDLFMATRVSRPWRGKTSESEAFVQLCPLTYSSLFSLFTNGF